MITKKLCISLRRKNIRDFCGNSFHPGALRAAFGDASQIRKWIMEESNVIKDLCPVPDPKSIQTFFETLYSHVEKEATGHCSSVDFRIGRGSCGRNVATHSLNHLKSGILLCLKSGFGLSQFLFCTADDLHTHNW